MRLAQQFIILLFGVHLSFVAGQIRFEPTTGSVESRLENLSEDINRLTDSISLNPNSNNNNSNLVWQPLRATFRPINRQPPTPPTVPPIPAPPTPPLPPPAPLALSPASDEPDSNSSFELFSRNRLNANNNDNSAQPPVNQPISTILPVTTPLPSSVSTVSSNLDDEDLPTRIPLNRFRPTRAPSVDPQPQPVLSLFPITSGSQNATSLSPALNNNNPVSSNQSAAAAAAAAAAATTTTTGYKITNECFECICEASTSCNLNSRCQTSDVRHTRCGMFLISYDQWLATGLSRELVTRDALARDPAADERAFYECVTDRECAERLMAIYAEKNSKDCDKDGRVDCYDIAAIHQGGRDQCSSEVLLESQYWSDFNACFGFGR